MICAGRIHHRDTVLAGCRELQSQLAFPLAAQRLAVEQPPIGRAAAQAAQLQAYLMAAGGRAQECTRYEALYSHGARYCVGAIW